MDASDRYNNISKADIDTICEWHLRGINEGRVNVPMDRTRVISGGMLEYVYQKGHDTGTDELDRTQRMLKPKAAPLVLEPKYPKTMALPNVLDTLRLHQSIRSVCTAAYDWYKFRGEQRYYHNWDHALDVTTNVLNIDGDAPDAALVIAALWHDAVYVPGAQKNANEEASAAALLTTAAAMGLTDTLGDVLLTAANLIRVTVIGNHVGPARFNGNEAVLLDADIAGLACEWSLFCERQDNILREMGLTVNVTNRIQCGEFLMRMLSVRGDSNLYHTTVAQNLYGAKAADNITRYHSGERA